MRAIRRPEKRANPRSGLALRVLLRDHRPPVHAMSRNFSLGGMYVMTATRKLTPGLPLTVEIETGRSDNRWSPPLPVRVVWQDQTNAGIEFDNLPAQAAAMLCNLLEDTRQRHTHPHRRRTK